MEYPGPTKENKTMHRKEQIEAPPGRPIETSLLKRALSEFKFFLLIMMIMGFMAVSAYLATRGYALIGIPLWILFAFLFFGGWQWIKEDRRTAIGVLLSFLVVYTAILILAVFLGRR